MPQSQISIPDTVAIVVGYIGTANIVTALVALNFSAFAMFGIDKAKAEAGAWRVQESTLLTLAFFGGTIGAYAGRALFRHKTRKEPFSSNLFTIAVWQTLGIGALIGWMFI